MLHATQLNSGDTRLIFGSRYHTHQKQYAGNGQTITFRHYYFLTV
jgi:hypothetical protein